MGQQYDAALIDREYEHYFPRLVSGIVTLEEVQKELENRNIQEQNIKFVVDQLKRDIVRIKEKKNRRWSAIAGFFSSLFISIVGVLLIMYTIAIDVEDIRSGLIALGIGLGGMATSAGVYVNNNPKLK